MQYPLKGQDVFQMYDCPVAPSSVSTPGTGCAAGRVLADTRELVAKMLRRLNVRIENDFSKPVRVVFELENDVFVLTGLFSLSEIYVCGRI
jgi:hypothetical protein